MRLQRPFDLAAVKSIGLAFMLGSFGGMVKPYQAKLYAN
jgi:hypothetical protein